MEDGHGDAKPVHSRSRRPNAGCTATCRGCGRSPQALVHFTVTRLTSGGHAGV